MPDLGETHAHLLVEVREMTELAQDDGVLAARAEQVSRWSVAQQLEHLAVSDLQVLALLRKLREQPDRDAGRRPHPVGLLLMALNWIPRGVGKAPEFAQPKGVDPTSLRAQLAAVLAATGELGPDLPALAHARGRFRHPRFGWLDLGQWLRFLRVHHHHHLKIVHDIRRVAGRAAG